MATSSVRTPNDSAMRSATVGNEISASVDFCEPIASARRSSSETRPALLIGTLSLRDLSPSREVRRGYVSHDTSQARLPEKNVSEDFLMFDARQFCLRHGRC